MTTQTKMNKIEEVRAKLQAQAERVAQVESQAVRGGRRPAARVSSRHPVSRRKIANSFLIALLLILIGGTGGILYSTYTTYLDTQSIRAGADQLNSSAQFKKLNQVDFGVLLRAAIKKDEAVDATEPVDVAEPVAHPETHAEVAAIEPAAEEQVVAPETAPVEEAPAPQPEPPVEVVATPEPTPEAAEPAPAPEAAQPEPPAEAVAAEAAPEAAPVPAPEAPAAAEPAPAPAPEAPAAEPQPEPAPEQPAPVEPPPAPRVLPFAP